MKRVISIVEDEKDINNLVAQYLRKEGYEVHSYYTYEEASAHVADDDVHLWILDIMLDDKSGFDLIEEIRLQGPETPVIFMSARDKEFDRIIGLEKGSDDYITKPFNILEVKARIKAIMRRARSEHEEKEKAKTIEAGDLKLDCESRRVFIAGKEINLTAKEFDVLELLVFNPNKVYSRENLLNIVWGYEYPGDARTVDVHIRRLREKIEVNPSDPKYVYTKWGVGYYFRG